MKSLLVVLNDAPYKNDKAFNALRAADTAVKTGTKVEFFLLGDSVYVVRKKHRPPVNTPNLENMIIDLIKRGIKFKVCGTCVNARGFEPKEGEIVSCLVGKSGGGLSAADLIDNAEISTINEFINLVDKSEKILTF